jgi:PsbP-like protein
MVVLKGFIAVIISILAIFIAPAYGQNQTQSQSQEWVTYEDPILGISVQHPEGWEPIAEPDTLKFEIYDNESKMSIFTTITVFPTTEHNVTNEEFMKGLLNLFRGEISKVHEVSNTTVSGIPASKAVYLTKDDTGNDSGRIIAYVMLTPDKSYIITFITQPTDYDKHIPTIQKMISSFKIE